MRPDAPVMVTRNGSLTLASQPCLRPHRLPPGHAQSLDSASPTPDVPPMAHHPSRGPSQRQLRVGELIRQRLSEILMRGDIYDPDINRASITVGEVQVSPDLRHAKVYVLPLGGQGTDTALEALARNAGELRRQVIKGLNLKYAPELRFFADETFDRMDETRALLDSDAVRRDLGSNEDR